MAMKLKVTLVRSGINRPEPQKRTIARLGLRKMHRTRGPAGQPGGPWHDPRRSPTW